jgi:hypothetical protein
MTANDIQLIVEALRQRQIQVTGPERKGEESVYRVNEHTLMETELRTLATEDQATACEVFTTSKVVRLLSTLLVLEREELTRLSLWSFRNYLCV